MPLFSIDTEVLLGISHSGEVTAEGTGTVELTDEEVQKLIDLIRENNGETDVEKLELEEKYPDIYETLDEAYRDAASEANFREWLMEGYERDYFSEPEDFMDAVEADGLFKFEITPEMIEEYRDNMGLEEDEEIDQDDLDEYFEDAKRDAFYECIGEYYNSLDDDGKVDFIEQYYGDVMDEGDPGGFDYEVQIPPEIIRMANVEQ